MDKDIKEYLDTKFEMINDRFKLVSDIKKTVDTIAEKIPPLSERITGCEKDIKYMQNNFDAHCEEIKYELDKAWNKNREQDKNFSDHVFSIGKKFDAINQKIYFYAGGIAVIVFLISIFLKRIL